MGEHYKEEFKMMVVQEYLGGLGFRNTLSKHELAPKRLRAWVRQYRETGRCEDRRGKSPKAGKGSGRPKLARLEEMTREEYIRHLEMENDILKMLSSLNSRKPK